MIFKIKALVAVLGFGCGFVIGKSHYERTYFETKKLEINDALGDLETSYALLFELTEFMLDGFYGYNWDNAEWADELYNKVIFLNISLNMDEEAEIDEEGAL